MSCLESTRFFLPAAASDHVWQRETFPKVPLPSTVTWGGNNIGPGVRQIELTLAFCHQREGGAEDPII